MTASRTCSHRSSPIRKKAVVALKWTVREMENRYRDMSKLGVRNIDGYNQRLDEAEAQGETLSRKVQTGFDQESGQPIYEEKPFDTSRCPIIVVVVDEMADLMMVAGKDIEAAIQRLAQMARAAGIHIVHGDPAPSVDVITGTIKANFPTRISFQVTSKIDSRTILGEQGAEQLLGQRRHAVHGGRRPHHPRARALRLRRGGREGRALSQRRRASPQLSRGRDRGGRSRGRRDRGVGGRGRR